MPEQTVPIAILSRDERIAQAIATYRSCYRPETADRVEAALSIARSRRCRVLVMDWRTTDESLATTIVRCRAAMASSVAILAVVPRPLTSESRGVSVSGADGFTYFPTVPVDLGLVLDDLIERDGTAAVLRFRQLEFRPSLKTLSNGRISVPISASVMRILHALFLSPDERVSRQRLRELCFDPRQAVTDKTIRLYVARARKAIHRLVPDLTIEVVPNTGFFLAPRFGDGRRPPPSDAQPGRPIPACCPGAVNSAAGATGAELSTAPGEAGAVHQ